MHSSKIFLRSLFIFLTIFIFSTPALAVGVQGGTLVATVSIKDAKITSQDGNTFNIAFSITNEEGAQNDVQYGVQLFSETPKGNFVVDEKIFDEKLDLPENSSLRKGISYAAPSMLSGTYQLLLVSKNSDGFPFAFYSLGKVTTAKTVKGVQIAPESCTIKTDKNTPGSPLSKMAILGMGAPQAIEISCVATNTDAKAVSVTPVFKTNLRDSFGDSVEVPGSVMEPISFKANEKKTVSLKVPLATKPQTYNTALSFNIAGVDSNSVSFKYLISGPSVTISNLSLDKDYYKRGETAALSLVWLSTAPKTFIEASIESKYGMKCAKTIDREITPSTNEILFPISSACRDPHVSVSIKDDKGTVLDQKDFSIKTSSVEPGNSKTPFIVVVVLALLAVVMFVIRKNKKDQNSSNNITNNILPIIILAGLGSFIPLQSAHAFTYTSGPNNSVVTVVDVVPTTYAPNTDIYLSYLITNNHTSSLPITFKAINDIGLGASNPSHVYIPQPTTFAAGQQTNGGFPIYDNLTFDAPGSAGTYNVTFETGVDTPTAIYVKVETIDNNTWYTGPNYCDSGWNEKGYVDFYHNTTTERASFFSDAAGGIPLDVTGLNLELKQGAYFSTCSGGACQCVSPQTGTANVPVTGTYYEYPGYSTMQEFTQQYGSNSCDTQTVCESLGYMTFDGSNMPVPYYFLPPPPQASISAVPSYIYTGESTTIYWGSSYANSCTSSDFATGGAVSGEVTVSSAGTYSVTCTNGVYNDTKSVTVYDLGPEPIPVYCWSYPGVTIQCAPESICQPDYEHPGFQSCGII